MIAIDKSDFAGVGQIAKHCDQDKLNIAIEEAIYFDLKPILCDFFFDLWDNWDSATSQWQILVEGGTYTNCKDNNVVIMGIRKVLVYFSYARYVIINSYDDSPNGQVNKQNEWSIPKPLTELKAFANKYKDMGYIALKEAQRYICSESDFAEFEDYLFADCEECACGKCGGQSKAAGYGLKSTTIIKNGL